VHNEILDGSRWLGGTIRYVAPDGTLLGDKHLDFSQDPYIPLYLLKLPLEHYQEGIVSISPKRIELVKSRDGKRKTDEVARVPGMAADSGFNSLLLDRFDSLDQGKTLHFEFAVAGQLDAYQFRARKIGDLTFEGLPAMKLRVEPDSLLRLFVDPLTLVYSKPDRRLREYEGVSNVHDPATGTAYNVRIVYPSEPPADAPAKLPPL
jgi:hypothetical protein